jgi:Circadian oscillating protein COP23
MKSIETSRTILACTIAAIALTTQSVRAQLPPNVDDNTAKSGITITDPADNSSQIINASGSSLVVSCQDLKTVVQKGDRQAVMLTWNYDGFGRDYTPEKRCQIVSERLQKAANINGGTFKDLQLASGTVNSLVVICALRAKSSKCNSQNMLFTLKPENALHPEVVIKKIFSFARNGSSSIEESASKQPSLEANLGKWEEQAFPQNKKFTTVKKRNPNTGF